MNPSFPLSCISNTAYYGGIYIAFTTIPTYLRILRHKDEDVLPDKIRMELEDKVKILSNRLQLQKPIELRVNSHFQSKGAEATGTALLPDRAIIGIDPAIISNHQKFKIPTSSQTLTVCRMDYEKNPALSKEELEFILAHELSHIKSNDLLTFTLATTFVIIIKDLIESCLDNSQDELSTTIIKSMLFIISMLFISLFISRWREKAADLRALSVCSPEARAASSRVFQEQIEINKEIRNSTQSSFIRGFLNRLRISKDGNNRLDQMHPPLTERVAYLQKHA